MLRPEVTSHFFLRHAVQISRTCQHSLPVSEGKLIVICNCHRTTTTKTPMTITNDNKMDTHTTENTAIYYYIIIIIYINRISCSASDARPELIVICNCHR